MEVKKIANLSEAELKVLTDAGQLLGSINKAFEAGEIDALDETVRNLLGALNKVLDEVRSK